MTRKSILYGIMAFILSTGAVAVGWFEWRARQEGFAHLLDQRASHRSGVIDAAEWSAMKANGDVNLPASGGQGCTSQTCHAAALLMEGRWRGGESCEAGSIYRFSDGQVAVDDFAEGGVRSTIFRSYRIVGERVPVPLGFDWDMQPLAGTVDKLRGDLEVWSLGKKVYVRRIFRAVDADTIMLVLVQERRGDRGSPRTLYIHGQSTKGHAVVTYRRCAP